MTSSPVPPSPPPAPRRRRAPFEPGQRGRHAVFVLGWLSLAAALSLFGAISLFSPLDTAGCLEGDTQLICTHPWAVMLTGLGATGVVAALTVLASVLTRSWSRAVSPWVGLVVAAGAALAWSTLLSGS